METHKVKSGKEILEDFFKEIENIPEVDKDIASSLAKLYQQGKFTDINVKNDLLSLREKNGN